MTETPLSDFESVIKESTKKHGNPNGTQYEQGVQDHGNRLLNLYRQHLRLSESHPSAIREAVEGEREACAKLVAAYGIAGMPFDVGSWTPGAVAAAIRARGEEKENG